VIQGNPEAPKDLRPGQPLAKIDFPWFDFFLDHAKLLVATTLRPNLPEGRASQRDRYLSKWAL
jgi:hypothetical protein